MSIINPVFIFFLIMWLIPLVLSILAWFRYSTFVNCLEKRQEILRRLGLPVLPPRFDIDLEEPFFKWYARIGLLMVLIVTSFIFIIALLGSISDLK